MTYLSDGRLVNGKRWSFADYFWIPLNFIVLFFQTLFNPGLSGRGHGYASSNYIHPDHRGGPPGPRRRMGRIIGPGDSGGSSPPPLVGGG